MVPGQDERGLCNCVITGLALRYVLYKSSFVAFLSQKWLICFEDEADSKAQMTFGAIWIIKCRADQKCGEEFRNNDKRYNNR
ncbi:unnamed protein product [Rangifer tarandus platyrhynchus]|uniref:Uncharacterized protein n=2 Tax=Rangifer tarandus platyrhynchus TaxID=3082113 RepID=A0ACB0E349_RANTA|nr:unnamed protein product [Rangifer tarandus platyrhynchus]CAI9694931.1 unnamed protein product [Rangifer tarandus platyrhynchus]